MARCTSVVMYREALDGMSPTEFVWMPYIGHAPLENTPGHGIWRAVVPLICYEVVEWHQPDRVMRQFGMMQFIPRPPRHDPRLHNVDRRSNITGDWPSYYEPFIQVWNNRERFIVNSQTHPMNGPMHLRSFYMMWFRQASLAGITPQGAGHRHTMDLTERLAIKFCPTPIETPELPAIPPWPPSDPNFRSREGGRQRSRQLTGRRRGRGRGSVGLTSQSLNQIVEINEEIPTLPMVDSVQMPDPNRNFDNEAGPSMYCNEIFNDGYVPQGQQLDQTDVLPTSQYYTSEAYSTNQQTPPVHMYNWDLFDDIDIPMVPDLNAPYSEPTFSSDHMPYSPIPFQMSSSISADIDGQYGDQQNTDEDNNANQFERGHPDGILRPVIRQPDCGTTSRGHRRSRRNR